MASPAPTGTPRTSQGPLKAGTTRGTRNRTQMNTKENKKELGEENTRKGTTGRTVQGEGHPDTPKMSSKPQRTSGALDTRKNKQNIQRAFQGQQSGKDGGKSEAVEGRRRSGRGKKDPVEAPEGEMLSPGGGRMLKDSRRILKDTKIKEEEEEDDFAAIERKIFEGQKEMINYGKQRMDRQSERVLGGNKRRTAMPGQEKRRRKREEEELDFAAIKRKIFEGQEATLGPRKRKGDRQSDSVLGERRSKAAAAIKEEEGKERRTSRGNATLTNTIKRIKKEEEEEKEEEDKKKTGKEIIKKSVKKEEEKKEGKPAKTSQKMMEKKENRGIATENVGETKQKPDNAKRGREPLPTPPGGGGGGGARKQGEANARTRTQTEKRKTDVQKEQKKRESEESKKRKREVTERHRGDAKRKKTPNECRTKSDGDKNKEDKEEKEERKRTGGKSRDRRGQTGRKTTAPPSDSEGSDWEEVGEMEGVDEVAELLSQAPSATPQGEGGVRIELDAPETLWGMRKRKKRRTEEELIEAYLRRKVNETIRKVSQSAHKTHLLCLLAHGRHLNAALGNGTLLGAALSTTPGKNAHPPGRLDLTHLQRLVVWFGKKFPRSKQDLEKGYWDVPVEETLVKRFGAGEVRSVREAVLCFVALCRALAISARLVMALQPLSWKPAPGTLVKPNRGEGDTSGKSDVKPSSSKSKDLKPPSSSSSSSCKTNERKTNSKVNRKMLSSDSETSPPDQKRGRGRGGGGGKVRGKVEEDEEEEEEDEAEDEEDDDFQPRNTKFRKPINKTQKRRKSQEEEGGGGKKKEGEVEAKKRRKTDAMVEWAEVFVEEEEKWVCVDVVQGKIHCVADIETRMPPGSAYITAFNPDLTVKDVTQRYVSRWLSSEKKLRCCSEWWAKSLQPFRGQRSARDVEEDKELENALHLQPLPKTVTEYKNHPLYALQRHLLKFEAIYPPDVSPAGFFKGEPVYPRSSVYNLHSRDTWMKEAKSVRVDEEPYKTVKARPKWDRVACQVIKDRPLELFGEWQVEDYEPPVASGGKVPRNEYGNVELFKPSMLPRGCVHIQVSGINRLARKLNIDCAAAMVGFDFHSGWTHPVYDGFVVCEEFKDVLMDAWYKEQEEQARKALEKRKKRIYGNWRKLIKGLLVRDRVRQEYGVSSEEEGEQEEEEEEGANKGKKRKSKKTEDKDSANKSTDDNGSRKKVKQVDIDALAREDESKEMNDDMDKESDPASHHPRPRAPLITHQVKNLSIDLTSNVVEMAKKSRQRTMKTKNAVKRTGDRKRKEGGQGKASKVKTGQGEGEKVKGGQEAGLSEESEESDEEEKKEKIRAILSWNQKSDGGDPDLSDDSDAGGSDGDGSGKEEQPPVPFLGFSSPPAGRKTGQNARRPKRRNAKKIASGTESDRSPSSSRSTTPEPDAAVPDGPRRLSSRSAKRRVRTYKEEEAGVSEADISLDESDCEDKLYKPVKD